jgi:hypothetical protein
MSRRGPHPDGCVYFLRLAGHCKIGCSFYGPHRAFESVSLHPEAVLIHTIASKHPYVIEGCIHRSLRKVRVEGEWFDLDKDDLDFFCLFGRCDTYEELVETWKAAHAKRQALIDATHGGYVI